MLKIVASNDSKYNKLIEKCTHELDSIENSAYQIDTEGFLHFQNQISNQENIKQIIFKELHDTLRKISMISKFYNNIKKRFILSTYEKEEAEYVSRCLHVNKTRLYINIQMDYCSLYPSLNGNGKL